MPDLDRWSTGITEIADSAISYRGRPIGPLVEDGDLAGALWLVLFGGAPGDGQADALRRALIAALDHGVTAPSTLSARAVASTRSSVPFAVAAGLVAFAGPAHGGAAEEAAMLFARIRDGGPDPLPDRAAAAVRELRAAGRRVPGYGHPYHRRDPRVVPLLAGTAADHRHRDIAGAVETAVRELTGRDLPMNADAAVAALLLDAGLAPADVTLVTALGRAFGLAAHAREEQTRERPFRAPGLHTVDYQGPGAEEARP